MATMQASKRRTKPDLRAKTLLSLLMSHRGWSPADVATASERRGTGHPDRAVCRRTVERVLETGHVPRTPQQFEIAGVFKTDDPRFPSLLPPHIWGGAPLPEPYAYLNDSLAMVA